MSKRQKIAFDLDEVLADVINPLIQFHNKNYGTSIKREEIFSYNLWDIWGGTKQEAIQEVYDFYKSKYFEKIKPIFYSREGVANLSRNNDLLVLTSRPQIIEEQTRAYIEKYFKNEFCEIYLTNQWALNGNRKTKSEICIEQKVDILIEDSLEYSLDCANKGINVLLFDCPWNQNFKGHENIIRVKNWKEIVERINEN